MAMKWQVVRTRAETGRHPRPQKVAGAAVLSPSRFWTELALADSYRTGTEAARRGSTRKPGHCVGWMEGRIEIRVGRLRSRGNGIVGTDLPTLAPSQVRPGLAD